LLGLVLQRHDAGLGHLVLVGAVGVAHIESAIVTDLQKVLVIYAFYAFYAFYAWQLVWALRIVGLKAQ
jgi:hypothetical protein